HSGVKILAETFPTRIERGAGLPPVERLAYLAELAGVQLADIEHLILVDCKAPVSFFAYPGKKSYLVPDTCSMHTLAAAEHDSAHSRDKLAASVGAANTAPVLQAAHRPGLPRGKLTAEKACMVIAHLPPDLAVVVVESITPGLMLNVMTAGCPRHDILT